MITKSIKEHRWALCLALYLVYFLLLAFLVQTCVLGGWLANLQDTKDKQPDTDESFVSENGKV